MKKQPLYIRALIAGGLLLATMPFLFKEYIYIPDFFRGFLTGMGMVFEIAGIVIMTRRRNAGASS